MGNQCTAANGYCCAGTNSEIVVHEVNAKELQDGGVNLGGSQLIHKDHGVSAGQHEFLVNETGRLTTPTQRGQLIQMALKEHRQSKAGLPNDEDFNYIDQIVQNGEFEYQQGVEEVKSKILSDGCQYTGQIEIVSQLKNGFGAQSWPDGAKYVGEWCQGKAEGKGTFYHTNGDVFMGQFQNDKANGTGKYVHKDRQVYEGQWLDDMQHGSGSERMPDGSSFTGVFQRGRKNGHGMYKWADNTTYEGSWKGGKIDGKGTYVWPDERCYTGFWCKNKLDGEGVYQWPDGRRYEGSYQMDQKHGFGIYKWPDGKQYEGFWFNGQQHGQGKFTNQEGKSRIGIWKDGQRIKWLPSSVTQVDMHADNEAMIAQVSQITFTSTFASANKTAIGHN